MIDSSRSSPVSGVFRKAEPFLRQAAHAIVGGDTVHYLWGRRQRGNYWVLMHSTASLDNPGAVSHDARNSVLVLSRVGFDDFTPEYPFLFWHPAVGKYPA